MRTTVRQAGSKPFFLLGTIISKGLPQNASELTFGWRTEKRRLLRRFGRIIPTFSCSKTGCGLRSAIFFADTALTMLP